MKKLIYTLIFVFGVALTSSAQEFKISEEKINVEKQTSIDISELTKIVDIEEYLVKDLITLQEMRYSAINDAEDVETKIAINKRFAIKIQGAFNDEQLAKINSNAALYKRLFDYE